MIPFSDQNLDLEQALDQVKMLKRERNYCGFMRLYAQDEQGGPHA